MLIIPEKRAIIILPPRTGSSTIHNAVREACPFSFMLYRHAERDAIPPGFEDFHVFGFVREPLARMWSLYKFLCILDPLTSATWAQEEVMRLLESVQGKTFEEWLLTNEEPFLPAGTGHPGLYQLHYKPETHKSQYEYLRPDLGTAVLPYSHLGEWLRHHQLPELHENKTTDTLKMPAMTPAIAKHLEQFMEWELAMNLEVI